MTNEKLELAHNRLVESVATLSTNSGWADYLSFAAKFHSYSARNVWLILSQREDATHVAGYETWKGLGRQVRKGAKGIAILAPCVFKKQDEDGTEHKVLGGFRIAYVFDVSDTDGDPIPANPAAPTLLQGQAPEDMWDYLVEQVETNGFHVELGEHSEHGENGYTQHASKLVRVVSGGRSSAAMCKTLAHELAHVLLHADEATRGDRGTVEIEAESVAYLVCDSFGLVSDDYSFGYVTTWAGADHKKVLAVADRVQKCATAVLAGRKVSDLVAA